MMPMPPVPPSQPPMPPAPPAVSPSPEGMACPHCAKPVMLQKPPMAGPSAKPAPKAPSKDAPKDKPAKKKNAASAPMDELKEVLKAKSNGND